MAKGIAKRESELRAVAAYGEAGSDVYEVGETSEARELFSGSVWLRANSVPCAAGPDLLAALKAVLDDYDTEFSVLTDGQYGKPSTEAYKTARRLVRQVEGSRS